VGGDVWLLISGKRLGSEYRRSGNYYVGLDEDGQEEIKNLASPNKALMALKIRELYEEIEYLVELLFG
jgi:hypothetical protein